MPIFFQQDINAGTRLAVWHIAEEEAFFLAHVPLQRAITHPHKRLQHLAGRYLLQHLFPDFPLSLIKIADTRKPYLEDEAYHFSISHCANYAAAIVSKSQRVGVDIEVPTEKVQKIANKFLHPEELIWATGNPPTPMINPASPVSLLTLLWSAKEAVFKWWSYGNVDFSEMIRLNPFALQEQGGIEGCFVGEETVPLTLAYRLFDGVTLAWVVQ